MANIRVAFFAVSLPLVILLAAAEAQSQVQVIDITERHGAGEHARVTTTSAEPKSAADPASLPGSDQDSTGMPTGADKEAWLLLKQAHDRRQSLPSDFKGFDANVRFIDDEKQFQGTISYTPDKPAKIEVTGPDKEEMEWLKDKLLSFIGHRRGGDFAAGDGKHPITFAAGPANAQGRQVLLHDKLDSKYRIKDKQVTEVTRTAGDSTFTISVIQTMTADPGKYLAKHFLVSYRNAKNGELEQVDGFRDSYKKIENIWFPQKRTVLTVTKEETTARTRTIELLEVKLHS